MGSSCRQVAAPAEPVRRHPDVILITIDTLRADRVGALGGPAGITPAIDVLAKRGAVFRDATAHAPLTLPSHASILTGRYPLRHGVHDNSGFALAPSVPTLAGVLKGAGYHTAAFVSSFVLRAATGIANGFETFDDRVEGLGRAHQTASDLERRGPETAREAVRWLASAPRPYFLWVHFYDPHAPYDPPTAFAERFPGRAYDAEVATSDFALSTLLAAIPEGRRAQTVIVVTGDHGESLGEHGESEHGILLYDSTLHVPLVIAGPGVSAGVSVESQVRHVDIVPTVAALVGVAAPAGVDGVNLLPMIIRSASDRHPTTTGSTSDARQMAIGGASDGHRKAIRSSSDEDPVARNASDAPVSYAESRFGELHFGWSPLRSVRDGAFKYIAGPDAELFLLTDDPAERTNRRDARPDTAAGMARVLADLTARADPSAAAAASPPPTADVAERLRSLGYVSGRVALGGSGATAGAAGAPGGEDPKREIARYEAYVKAFNGGLAHLESGRPRDAEAVFRRLARHFPLAFEAHQYLARALAARRAFADAAAEFDLAIRLSPREPAIYFDAARALADASQFDRAFARAAEGRRLDPTSYDGALTEGMIARAAGDRPRAEAALREAVRLNPMLSVAHLELGRMAEARGDRAAARAEYQRAVDADATLISAREALDRVAR